MGGSERAALDCHRRNDDCGVKLSMYSFLNLVVGRTSKKKITTYNEIENPVVRNCFQSKDLS
jgi:hypothetical protein